MRFFVGPQAGDYALKCAKVLGVEYPCPEEALKSRYRELAKVHHPDVGGNDDDFKAIVAAYKFLLPLATRGQENKHPIFDGFGLGIGRNVNAVKCDICLGHGFFGLGHTCHRCSGTGEVEMFNPVLAKGRMHGKQLRREKKARKASTGRFVTKDYLSEHEPPTA